MAYIRLSCSLAFLSLVLVICEVGAAPRSDLRLQRLLQRAAATGMGREALTRFTLEDIISQLGQSESELTESEVPADNEVHLDLERSTESGANQLPPRERKAGCKNFYWKTFTSC
ncbi:somatostatin-1A-like [Polypterus senegalus]